MLAAKFSEQKVTDTLFGATGLRESLRGKRVGNFLYNGRGKETR